MTAFVVPCKALVGAIVTTGRTFRSIGNRERPHMLTILGIPCAKILEIVSRYYVVGKILAEGQEPVGVTVRKYQLPISRSGRNFCIF